MRTVHWCWTLLVALMLLCNLCTPTESFRVIFFNRNATVQKSQLLSTNRQFRACPRGQMRDHRNRCRRGIIFGRKMK